MVLEQDLARVQSLGKQIPTEVYGVLRMFDGHRVLADVLEDSPYRVFETLRVAQRAVEAGLLRVVEKQQARGDLARGPRDRGVAGRRRRRRLGADREAEAGQRADGEGLGPVARDARSKASRKPRRNKKKRRADTPAALPIASPGSNDIDWGALVPRIVGAEVGPLSGVVPASHVSGEIEAPTPAVTREMHDTQPTIVFDEAAELARDASARSAAEADARARDAATQAEAERLAAEARTKAAAALAEADARAQEAAAQADAVRRAAEAAAEADAVRRAAEAAAEAEAAVQADAQRRVAEAAAHAEAERLACRDRR